MTDENPRPRIPDFYNGKTIFITGASGFIGKVLLEKLLRSCPDVKQVYLLMRAKRGKTPEDRIKAITDLPLFNRLKEEQPDSLKKIRLILGDVSQLRLGLSEEDRKRLIAETNIVFHGAASVRFNDPLSDSVLLNTRGTRETMNLCLEMKNLLVVVHISTTYSHTDRKVIGEQLYPPHADWRKTIEIAEKVDKNALNFLTKKYMGALPNTYTFAKSLSEHVVNDLCAGKIPAVIVRPSIVISTIEEPMPGWIDNFNGPCGILVACGKGILRSVHTDSDNVADYVPVDLIAKALIVTAWKKATTEDPKERLEASFYNASNNDIQPVTMAALVNIGRELNWEYPVNNVLWYPNGNIVTSCYYYHYIRVIFYQLLPALIIDGILKLAGHKPLVAKIQRKIYCATTALSYFTTNRWKFINEKSYALEKDLLPDDLPVFSFDKDNMEIRRFFINATIGGRKYLLKEDDASWPQAYKHSRRMYFLRLIVNTLWVAAIFWFVFFKIDILAVLYQKYEDMCIYFTTP